MIYAVHLIAGIDEAGRGPMIGPMVMVLAGILEEKLPLLLRLGVKDSKLLSPTARERIRGRLLKILDMVVIRVVSPEEIDAAVERKTFNSLNDLELHLTADLIRKAMSQGHICKVYVDSPDPKPERYASRLRTLLPGYKVEIVSENDADKKFPIVSAASIIAKTERDRIVERLKKEYGDFGSGYPSDPRTREFAKKWLMEHGSLPPIARRSWKTWRNILGEIRQRQLY